MIMVFNDHGRAIRKKRYLHTESVLVTFSIALPKYLKSNLREKMVWAHSLVNHGEEVMATEA